MKKVHVVMHSALLLPFRNTFIQAQRSVASRRNNTSSTGTPGVSNVSGTGATAWSIKGMKN